MPRLTDAQNELYSLLTSRTFYVVDTEYTPAPEGETQGNRIISIAIAPVVAGRRAPVRDELYRVMNPGVPISPGTTHVHGFTDAAVRRKPDFSAFAREIVDFLSDPDAVFVSHTAADIYALRGNLALLDDRRQAGEATINAGLTDLPDLPLLDTSTLPRLVAYPGMGARGIIGLAQLVELTGVSYTNAHDARHDARATADALLALLTHAAQTAAFLDLDELLREHDAGTTHQPRRPIYIRSRDNDDPLLPPGHLSQHLAPLIDPATAEQVEAWVAMATSCAKARCPWLRDEAAVAAPINGHELLDKTTALLATLTEPGQAGTLLGAIVELIRYRHGVEVQGLRNSMALRWWGSVRDDIKAATRCGEKPKAMCPHCRESNTCPSDMIYELVAEIGLRGRDGVLDVEDRKKFFSDGSPSMKWKRWREEHPELLAWAEWRVITQMLDENEATPAARALRSVVRRGQHLIEPRLTQMVCADLANTGQLDEALELASDVLANRTTNQAYQDLETWVAWTLSQAASEAEPLPSEPMNPRLARPLGRIGENPYKVAP